LAALPRLLEHRLQVVVVGEGDPELGAALRAAAAAHPARLAVHLGYTEELAHQVEAGADMFLMPSRFEPCGLTQLYSLRYGTVPVVRRPGGLKDTVVDADAVSLGRRTATGFQFETATPEALVEGVERALACFGNRPLWRQLVRSGMDQD